MSGHAHPGEYENEPIRGLPEVPPEGEEILWQGSPDWRSLALRAFHVRKVAVYFALLLVWSAAAAALEAQPLGEAAFAALRLALLGGVAVALLAGIAWRSARSAVYTITSRRVVMRFGIALEMAVNFPFGEIQSADLRTWGDGTGDLSLEVSGAGRIGHLMLWPFARPWRFGARTQPMLRSIPDAEAVAGRLARALETSARTGSAEPDASGPAPWVTAAA